MSVKPGDTVYVVIEELDEYHLESFVAVCADRITAELMLPDCINGKVKEVRVR
jgi:hypothetical protein